MVQVAAMGQAAGLVVAVAVRMRILLTLPRTGMVAMLSTGGPEAAEPLLMLTAAREGHLFTAEQAVLVAAQTQVVASKTVA